MREYFFRTITDFYFIFEYFKVNNNQTNKYINRMTVNRIKKKN